MNVVVNQIVAVLQVLSLGNAVGRNQDIDIHLAVRHEEFSALRNRRKASEHVVESCRKLFYRALSVHASRDDGGIQSVARFQKGADLLIEILRSIGKCREDEHFFVAFVNRVLYFLREQVKELLQLAVMCGRKLRDQLNELIQNLLILFKLRPPADPVHIRKRNVYFLTHLKEVIVFIVEVKVDAVYRIYNAIFFARAVIAIYFLDGRVQSVLNPRQG